MAPKRLFLASFLYGFIIHILPTTKYDWFSNWWIKQMWLSTTIAGWLFNWLVSIVCPLWRIYVCVMCVYVCAALSDIWLCPSRSISFKLMSFESRQMMPIFIIINLLPELGWHVRGAVHNFRALGESTVYGIRARYNATMHNRIACAYVVYCTALERGNAVF